MSQRSSRTPAATVAALVFAFVLCLLPGATPADAADLRIRVRPAQTESRLLDRLERLRAALWQDIASLWGKAGARIDDNGKPS